MNVSIVPAIHQFIYPFTHACIHPSIYQPTTITIHLSIKSNNSPTPPVLQPTNPPPLSKPNHKPTIQPTNTPHRHECKMLLNTSSNHLVHTLIKLFHSLLGDVVTALNDPNDTSLTTAQVTFVFIFIHIFFLIIFFYSNHFCLNIFEYFVQLIFSINSF